MSEDQSAEPAADEAAGPDATAIPETPAEAAGQPETGADDVQAQLEKWKVQARKNEAKAKANAEAARRLHEV
jgi:hypothetical protein